MQRELVLRARNGDHDAFAVLAAGAFDRLHRTARLILHSDDRAADAVQESLMAAWLHIRAVRDPDRFDAWLHRLLVRSCHDELRKNRRRPVEVELTEIGMSHPTDEARSFDERDELERGFRRLDADQRLVVVLHYYLDLPLPEVASMLGVPVGTAKSRLHRALAVLRRTIGAQRETARLAEEVAR